MEEEKSENAIDNENFRTDNLSSQHSSGPMNQARGESMQAVIHEALESGENSTHTRKLLHYMSVLSFEHEIAGEDV